MKVGGRGYASADSNGKTEDSTDHCFCFEMERKCGVNEAVASTRGCQTQVQKVNTLPRFGFSRSCSREAPVAQAKVWLKPKCDRVFYFLDLRLTPLATLVACGSRLKVIFYALLQFNCEQLYACKPELAQGSVCVAF